MALEINNKTVLSNFPCDEGNREKGNDLTFTRIEAKQNIFIGLDLSRT